jgi:uncharacterized repeat protein (TIGR01451 family)
MLHPQILLPLLLAQPPLPPPPPPKQGPAPLLHVRFDGPPGVQITFYQGRAPARRIEVPVTVGLRPGYIYRLKVTGFPSNPWVELHPTIEVRGTLRLPPDLAASRHPAPVYFSELDMERLLDGSFITKVMYLEHPKKAFAEPARKDQPFEVEVPPDRDLLDESRNYGRPVLVIRNGNRDVSEEALREESSINTILFPNERDLGWPRRPPQLPYITWQWYDPIAGPKKPEEECLMDGGDRDEPVGIAPDGRLTGLDSEDTVAEYRDSQGVKRLTVSNRVCLCVPRFAVLRQIMRLDLNRLVLNPGSVRKTEAGSQLENLIGLTGHEAMEHLADVTARQSLSEFQAMIGTTVVGRVEGTQFVKTRLVVADLSVIARQTPETKECPLVLTKWCDRCEAEIGDEVEFTLKFSNPGGRAITDVIVSDSLTPRLEYVPGSAQSSRNAVFTTQPNESGSLILRWQINGTLQPGESGVVRFRAKIR